MTDKHHHRDVDRPSPSEHSHQRWHEELAASAGHHHEHHEHHEHQVHHGGHRPSEAASHLPGLTLTDKHERIHTSRSVDEIQIERGRADKRQGEPDYVIMGDGKVKATGNNEHGHKHKIVVEVLEQTAASQKAATRLTGDLENQYMKRGADGRYHGKIDDPNGLLSDAVKKTVDGWSAHAPGGRAGAVNHAGEPATSPGTSSGSRGRDHGSPAVGHRESGGSDHPPRIEAAPRSPQSGGRSSFIPPMTGRGDARPSGPGTGVDSTNVPPSSDQTRPSDGNFSTFSPSASNRTPFDSRFNALAGQDFGTYSQLASALDPSQLTQQNLDNWRNALGQLGSNASADQIAALAQNGKIPQQLADLLAKNPQLLGKMESSSFQQFYSSPEYNSVRAMGNPADYMLTEFWSKNWNPDGPSHSSSCGPSSLIMAALHFGKLGNVPLDPKQAENAIKEACAKVGTSEFNGTTLGQLENGAKNLGLQYKLINGIDAIDQQLAAGHMVVAEGNPAHGDNGQPGYNRQFKPYSEYSTGNGPGGVFSGGHFICVDTKLPNGNYVVNDPACPLGPIVLTRQQLQGYLDGDGGGGLAVWG